MESSTEELQNGNGGSSPSDDNSSVRVALRIRPSLPREIIEGCKTCTTVAEGHPQVWIGSNNAYTYDYVFDIGCAQSQIFDDVVKPLVDGCLKGYNATILAYGQTGSGKTYTMGTGFEMDPSPDTQGIIPRAVIYLFQQMENIKQEFPDSKADFTVQLNFVELYNEEVVDLLGQTSARPSSAVGGSRPSSANAPIRIHEDATGSIYLAGVHTLTTASAHETLKVLRDGALSRTTASTNMNDTSSRSHAIFTMHVIQKRISTELGEAELETLSAKFHFVDLAGSERLKRTMATGERAKEGISINCGLLALGNVISALGDKAKKASHVPYRDSKLTRLLQDSLGGNSRTVMIACVSPSDRDFVETLNTLKYANRARNIKNRVHINQDKSSQTIARLAKEIADLKAELLEFKQGKRTGGEVSAYSDTYQENILLLTEIETLKSRLKSKQDSIDKLTGTVASYETQMEINLLSDSDCDLTKMVKKYLLEIEDLRTKLYESEQECEKLRMKQRRLNETLASPRKLFTDTINKDDALLDAAKQEVESDRKKLEKITNSINKIAEDGDTGNDEPVDSESDSEDESQEENYEAIAQLTSEISIKERLIEQLEQSQIRVENMKLHYEQKLECLNNKIKATIEERDKVMACPNLKGKRSTQLHADYEKKISEMQQEAKKWQAAQKQHMKAIKDQSQYEKQISRLRTEVDSLKQTKVKLVNQAKADSAKFREIEQRRLKEINSLKKQSRTKEIQLRSMENERNMKDQVLKRKIEEVNNLKKQQKMHMSRSAQGRVTRKMGSPIKAKNKWTSLEHEIRKAVTIKSTVASLEKEMLNMINERTEARKRLDVFENYLMKDDIILEEIESTKVNLQFLDDKIQEIQAQIMDISTTGKEYDGADLDEHEVRYMFKKLYETNLNNTLEIDRYERRMEDSEENIKQLNKELSQLRTLLNHVVAGKKLSCETNGDITIPPLSSDAETVIVEESNSSKMRKLRRRLTATPQELLGSMDNVSTTNGDFLNPNDVLKTGFNRNSFQTRSLRSKPRSRPPLMRQDTYNVGDRKFPLDPPERLHSDTNFNSVKLSEKFDTTFLISSEKSPPTSSLSNNRLTYTSDSNNPSDIANITNNGKSLGIKKVSLGSKEKVMNLTHVAESHTKPVISLCATERRLYSGSKDSTVKEYDLYSGVELATYSGHPSNVQCIQLIEDSDILISASGSIVTLWDIRTGLCTKTLMSSGATFDRLQASSDRLLQPGESLVQSVAVLRNYLYTTVDNRIRVWDMRKLQGTLGILAGKHSSHIMCLATAQNLKLGSSNCDVIVSGSKDHYIKLYITEPEQTIETIKPRNTLNPPHYDGIESLLIKDTHLYSGSRDTCIKKWDLASEKMLCTAANAHGNWITGLSNLPSSLKTDCVISSSRDGSVKIWDKDLRELYKADLAPGISTSVDSICVNSQLLFTAGGVSHNGSVSVWKLDEVALRSLQSASRREPYKYYPLSPRLSVRKSNTIRYSSHEDLMTRSDSGVGVWTFKPHCLEELLTNNNNNK